MRLPSLLSEARPPRLEVSSSPRIPRLPRPKRRSARSAARTSTQYLSTRSGVLGLARLAGLPRLRRARPQMKARVSGPRSGLSGGGPGRRRGRIGELSKSHLSSGPPVLDAAAGGRGFNRASRIALRETNHRLESPMIRASVDRLARWSAPFPALGQSLGPSMPKRESCTAS